MPNKARRVEFGKWLKAQRENKQLTQMDLAKLLNYDNPQIISNIERGFSALPAKRISEFAEHLGCKTLELEMRRMWSSTKDDRSAEVLEQVLRYIPILDVLVERNIGVEEAKNAVLNMRS